MNFLKEAARSPEELDDSSFVEVTRERSSAIRITLKIDGFPYGNILISRSRDFKPPAGYKMSNTLEGPCSGGFIARSSLAADGWGPMLYDVAMEIATIEGSGLIPDRNSVSSDAFSVWDYYERNRSDVKNRQLDDPQDTLTPIRIDNCKQKSAQLDVGEEFFKSPLSKIYSKEVDVLIRLDKMGKLKFEGDFSFYSKDNLGESMQDWEKKLKNKYASNVSSKDFDLDRATNAAVKVIIKSFESDLRQSGASEKVVDMFTLSMPIRIKKDLKNFLKTWIDQNADIEFEDDPEDPDKPSPYSLNLTDKRPTSGEWPRATLSKKLEEMKSFLMEDPCWDDYEMVGMKQKDGREVPNCVPKTNEAEEAASSPPPPRTVDTGMKQSLDKVIKQKKSQFGDEEYDLAPGEIMEFVRKLEEKIDDGDTLTEAEFQGREVTLNKPFRDPDVKKKFSVYVKDGDKVKKVNFGDPNMKIKKDNPERRKSFRARHNCDNPGPKTKARYWSCKKW